MLLPLDLPSPSSLTGIVDALQDPVFVMDDRFQIIFVNEALCRFLARSREQLIGKTEDDLFSQPQADAGRAAVLRVFCSGEPDEDEEVVTTPSGERLVVVIRRSLHHDESGRPILLGVITAITAQRNLEEELRRARNEQELRVESRSRELQHLNERLARDATRRQRAERRLRESEEELRNLLDSIPQYVWVVRFGGELEYANRQLREYLWGDRRAAPTKIGDMLPDILDRAHPDDRDRIEATWKAGHHWSGPFEAEFRVRAVAAETYRWHLIRTIPLPNPAGRVDRWLGTATDIDDKKRTEQGMEEDDRQKTEFLAVLAHELRNPLVPIRNASFILRNSEPGTSAFEQALSMVERQTVRVGDLIDNLFDVSRITRGKVVLHRQRIDLVTLTRAALHHQRERMAALRLSALTDLPSHPIWIDGDVGRITQAIGHLLENAIQRSNEDGTIEVRAWVEQGSAVLSVRNEGAALSERSLERIFTPFAQALPHGDTAGLGLGLRLAIVKSVAQLHGGTARASNQGTRGGSTFDVRIPLAEGSGTKPCEGSPPALS